jgi:hypothetical protein
MLLIISIIIKGYLTGLDRSRNYDDDEKNLFELLDPLTLLLPSRVATNCPLSWQQCDPRHSREPNIVKQSAVTWFISRPNNVIIY